MADRKEEAQCSIEARSLFGLGREPVFKANAEIANGQDQTADRHLAPAQQLSEARASGTELQRPSQEQAGPAPSIGARTV